MNINIKWVRYIVNDFIKYNGLHNYIFVPTNETNKEICLADSSVMEMFKHYLVNCTINIMIEWNYDINITPELHNKSYCRDIRCYLLEHISNFPYEMGYWVD